MRCSLHRSGSEDTLRVSHPARIAQPATPISRRQALNSLRLPGPPRGGCCYQPQDPPSHAAFSPTACLHQSCTACMFAACNTTIETELQQAAVQRAKMVLAPCGVWKTLGRRRARCCVCRALTAMHGRVGGNLVATGLHPADCCHRDVTSFCLPFHICSSVSLSASCETPGIVVCLLAALQVFNSRIPVVS
jgi:hypothetical protein